MNDDDRILYQPGRIRATDKNWRPGIQEYLATDKGIVIQADASAAAELPFLLRIGPGTAMLTVAEARAVYLALGSALADFGWKERLENPYIIDCDDIDPTKQPDYTQVRRELLDKMQRPGLAPGQGAMLETDLGCDLGEIDDATLAAAPATLPVVRELARRRVLVEGRPDHEPADGPEDSPDPMP